MLIKAQYKTFNSIFQTLMSLPAFHALRTHALHQLGWEESRRSRRAVAWGKPIPWLPYSCTTFLDQVVPRDAKILEFGGGGSTLWWLMRGNSVTTIETDPSWVEELAGQVKGLGLVEKWNFHLVSQIDQRTLKTVLGNNLYDLLSNDGIGNRSEITDAILDVVHEKSLIVWDNSDRPEYAESLNLLIEKKWSRLDFFGLLPINAYCSQTTVFLKTPIMPIGYELDFKIISN